MRTFLRAQGKFPSAKPSQRRAGLLLLAVICVATMIGVVSPAFATTYIVTPPGTTNCKAGTVYFTIQSAVTAAENSNAVTPPTIYVCPGTYAEQVLITKSLNLTGVAMNGGTGAGAIGGNNPLIVAPGTGVIPNATALDGSAMAAQIAIVSAVPTTPISVNVSDFTIDGSNNGISGCSPDFAGIYYQNANGTVNHVAARFQELSSTLFGCQTGLAIFAEAGFGTGGTSTVTIENNSVHDYQKNGITAHGSTTATISGNYVVGIGPTNQIAQNGIEVAFGAAGTVTGNTVSDDVYINDPNCCASASGILVYESGGKNANSQLTISSNVVSNTQGGVVLYGDTNASADFIMVTSNKITTTPAIPGYQLDGIDMCGNSDTAKSNNVLNSSGSGVHIDSTCTESSGTTGNNSIVESNTINEACTGVLLGNGTGSVTSGNITYSVVQTLTAGDICPAGTSVAKRGRVKPVPFR